jgi:hypothetical protein
MNSNAAFLTSFFSLFIAIPSSSSVVSQLDSLEPAARGTVKLACREEFRNWRGLGLDLRLGI